MRIGIILSGGTGTRVGSDIPKQYIEVAGKPIIFYCMEQIFSNVDKVIIVANEAWRGFVGDVINCHIEKDLQDKFVGFADPGENRQLSIYNALLVAKNFAKEKDYVLIHDAARPFVTEKIIAECFEASKECDGALPVLPMKDTVYLSEDASSITSLIDRQKVFAGQAPESFEYTKYLKANEALLPEAILKINGSTEPAIMAGMKISMIAGDEHNYKITSPADLERFKAEIES